MTYLTPADLLAKGLHLDLSDKLRAMELSPGTTCAITGQPITHGYPVSQMVTDATAEFLDCFRGGVHGYVSEAAARCFKNADPRKGNPTARSIVAFEDGAAWLPLINAQSAAEQGRPCWRDLVRQIWPERAGQLMLAILTTDTKKRLWIRARVGALGSQTQLYYYDSKTCGNESLTINWPEMLACLDLVETAYNLGFPKEVIASSLYIASKIMLTVGYRLTRELDRELAPWRTRPEFRPALLIAQKQPKEEEQTWKPEQITLPL